MHSRPQCTICFSPISFDKLWALFCGHTFHFRCAREWLKYANLQLLKNNKTTEIQCNVCLKQLDLKSVAALRCGHIFHLPCISRHVESNQKCRICHKKAEKNDIIPQLFFDFKQKGENNSQENPEEEFDDNDSEMMDRGYMIGRRPWCLSLREPNVCKFSRFYSNFT
ncbi:unnamed protein product [Cercopithifilaria johnstoni]|uniref:RING-type domain-containing protein n=1 Tax=Cercopithifilaria johnstoni TaxID=2874296 RepID=A0A8J2Q0A1_9BILA|nr:unnamed protein product [Cercopithifilaria johnstoni]